MVFNFKNNNFIIIFLLVLVIGSCVCYNIMENNVEGFNTNSSHYKFFKEVDNSGNDIVYNSLNFINYDFSFNSLNLNGDLIENAPLYQGSGPVPLGNSFDISCLDSEYNCFTKDSSFNIYKRIDASNIRCLLAPYNSSQRIDLISSPKSSVDPVGSVNIMFVTKKSDNSYNIYDLSGENIFRSLDIYIDNKHVIKQGVLQGFPNNDVTTTTISGNTVSATGGSFSMGDFNFPSLMNLGLGGGINPQLYAYMLENGNNHPNLNNYNPPFYSSFEAAMNNPSNPLVNPLNSMNPQQYSESLFGPNISPHMVKDMCKNSNLNTNSKVEREDTSTKNNNKNSGNNGNTGNTGNSGNGGNSSNTGNSLANNIQNSGNPMNDIFNKMNANSNNLLTQNSNESSSIQSNSVNNSKNSTNTINNNGSEIPPCPPCARCPQSDFECKKVPNYEQGLENPSLPRAVLTDFSTFGM